MKTQRFGLIAIFAMLVVGFAAAGTPAAAADEPTLSLAGSSSIPSTAQLQLSPGQSLPAVNYVTVQNAGSQAADIKFISNAPVGINIRPDVETARLEPGQTTKIHFGIEVQDFVAAGNHKIITQVQQTNVARVPGSISFTPAINASFTLVVGGAPPADLTLKAVSSNDGAAVSGNISLANMSDGQAFTMLNTNGTEAHTAVAPGDYQATFEIPNLVAVTKNFTVAAGERKVVNIEVTGVDFLAAGVTPQTDDGKIVTARMVAAIQNNLGILPGPVEVRALVDRNGERVETVTIDKMQSLPSGQSDVNLIWRPDAGFEPGTYNFTFQIVTPTFTVNAPQSASFDVPKPVSAIALVGIPTAVVVLVIAVIGWVVLRRKRRRTAAVDIAPTRTPIQTPTAVSAVDLTDDTIRLPSGNPTHKSGGR